MQLINHKIPALLIALLLLAACFPALAETAEIIVPNTPIKGIIQLEKQGPVLRHCAE